MELAAPTNWGSMPTTGPSPDPDRRCSSSVSPRDGGPSSDDLPPRRRTVHEVINPGVGRGLEIGPLCSPLVTKEEGDVLYVDVLSTEGLREHYATDPSVPSSLIVDVDFALFSDGHL